MLANNVPAAGLTDEDAWEVAGMLAATGRAVDPNKWVESLVHEDNMRSLDRIA